MDIKLINQLNQLNTDFYKTTATDFDDSRQYFWQGWDKIPPLLDSFQDIRVADIGCGNGRFGQFLIEKCSQIKISYTGIDSNKKLLEFAQKNLQGKIPALHLHNHDVVQSMLNNNDFLSDQTFQLITSFGVFHHIPSFELRLKLLKYLLSKLDKKGILIISLWQFMEFKRFQKKVLKNDINLNFRLIDLEPNDFILDWQRGEQALRYCHYISEDEQEKLIENSGSNLLKQFRSDGKEGNVNQYLVLTNNS